MAVYFVPATAPAEESAPADGDDYTYDLRPAPMRQEAKIVELQREIDGLGATTAGTIQILEAKIADLAARLDRLEEPARRTRQIMAALFGDGRIEA